MPEELRLYYLSERISMDAENLKHRTIKCHTIVLHFFIISTTFISILSLIFEQNISYSKQAYQLIVSSNLIKLAEIMRIFKIHQFNALVWH